MSYATSAVSDRTCLMLRRSPPLQLCHRRSVGQHASPRMNETVSRTNGATRAYAPAISIEPFAVNTATFPHEVLRCFPLIRQVESYSLPLRVKFFVDKAVEA